jgi:hypothetical protein
LAGRGERILGDDDRKELAATGSHETLYPLTVEMAQALVPTEEFNLRVGKMSIFEIGFAKKGKVTVVGVTTFLDKANESASRPFWTRRMTER